MKNDSKSSPLYYLQIPTFEKTQAETVHIHSLESRHVYTNMNMKTGEKTSFYEIKQQKRNDKYNNSGISEKKNYNTL